MKKLFECLYGSNLYGTNTATSDLDAKRIFLPSLDSLLLGKAPKNSFHSKSKKIGEKNVAGDVDFEEVPLHVFAEHFMEGQTYALELAFAIENDKAEQKIYDERFIQFTRELRENFLTSNINAMTGYAVNQAKLYSDKGDRLNTALAAEELYKLFPGYDRISDHEVAFNLEASKVAAAFPLYFSLGTYSIDNANTQRPCVKLLEKVLPYSNTFLVNLKVVERQIAKFGERAKAASMSTADWKATAHALRIVNEGIQLLSTGELFFPLPKDYCSYLLEVKNGNFPIEEIREKIGVGVDTLKSLSATSNLPAFGPELKDKFDVWLLGWLKLFYSLG